MNRSVPSALGLFGVGLGLFYSYISLTYAGPMTSSSVDPVPLILGLPTLAGSIIGLAGCLLYRRGRTERGGIFMLTGASIVFALLFYFAAAIIVTAIIENYWLTLFDASVLAVIYGPSTLTGLLLLLAGLLAMQKTRHKIKKILHNLSEKYYGFLETNRVRSLETQTFDSTVGQEPDENREPKTSDSQEKWSKITK